MQELFGLLNILQYFSISIFSPSSGGRKIGDLFCVKWIKPENDEKEENGGKYLYIITYTEKISLPLSLSLSYTHTHTHTQTYPQS